MDPTTWGAPFPVVLGALFFIVLARSNGTYWLGRLARAGAHRTRAARLMDSVGYVKATERVNRYGAPAVSLSFLTIGVQTLVNFAAGATAMPLRRYIPATIVGSVAWAFLYASAGYVGWGAVMWVYGHSPILAMAVLVVVVGVLTWYLVNQFQRHTKERVEDDSPTRSS